MNIDKKRLTIILLALYVMGMIISAFTLFNLQDKLIYDLNVLTISDAGKAASTFYITYLIVGGSMVLGLLALYYSLKSDEANVIYVEKTKDEVKREEEKADAEARKDDKLTKAVRSKLDKQSNNPQHLNKLLTTLCRELEASQGAIYLKEKIDGKRYVVLNTSFAMSLAESEVIKFEFGEGLVGQVAKEQKTLYLNDVPEGFVKIISGLGESSPSYLVIVPIIEGNELTGVIEISSFVPFRKNDIAALEELFITNNNLEEEQQSDDQEELIAVEVEKAATKPVKKVKKKKSEDK